MSGADPIRDPKPCYCNCLIFLLLGKFVVERQGRIIETDCAYRIKDKSRLRLNGMTTIVGMEEGEQKGACPRLTQESRDLILAKRNESRNMGKRAKK
jgi:hypothetical protein